MFLFLFYTVLVTVAIVEYFVSCLVSQVHMKDCAVSFQCLSL